MKRFPLLGALLLLPAMLMLGTVGCSPKPDAAKDKDAKDKGADKGADKGGDKGDKDKGTKASGKKESITTPLEATVSGTILFDGAPPEPKDIAAMKEHKDWPVCMFGDKREQLWLVDKDGGVANVVISLAPPAGKKFKLDDLKEKYKKSVVMDQPACAYEPHVVALWSDVQPLVAKNSSKVNHNVKIVGGADLGTKNFTIEGGKDTGEVWLKGAGEMVISAQCDIHGWMGAKIALFDSPYFAVTDAKGKFEIQNVPVDEELTVYMWHESNPKKVQATKKIFKKGANEVPTQKIK